MNLIRQISVILFKTPCFLKLKILCLIVTVSTGAKFATFVFESRSVDI